MEQRKDLVAHAGIAKGILGMMNVHFIHGNFTHLDLRNYDHFYFYNSFYENMHSSSKINDEVKTNQDLYHQYSTYVKEQLDLMPKGTRMVTYFSYMKEIPESYKIMKVDFDGKLKMLEKVH